MEHARVPHLSTRGLHSVLRRSGCGRVSSRTSPSIEPKPAEAAAVAKTPSEGPTVTEVTVEELSEEEFAFEEEEQPPTSKQQLASVFQDEAREIMPTGDVS